MKIEKDLCFNGEIITPNNDEYEVDRQIWNRAIQRYPKAIIYCKEKEEVVEALKFCIRNSFNFRIRSGGHNYEGFSIGNDIVVIDVSRMKKITIDEAENKLKVEAGVQNSELYEYVGSKGYPFPGGTCPTVGVVGYALGGGWGLSCRLFGLGADSLVEAEVIDYEGNEIIANRDCNEELFWALRGAGNGNFGIVTALTFNLPPKFNNVTLFTMHYENTSIVEQANIMDIFQKIYMTLDRRVNMRASFYNSVNEGMAVYFFGLFYGDERELKEILQPFLDIPNCNATFENTTFLNAIRKVQEGYPDKEKFKSTGRFVNESYSKYTLINLASFLKERPEGAIYTAITFYGLGGAVKDKGEQETAFYYRDANYIMGIQSVWENDVYADINKEWVASKLNYIMTITEGSFINFPYSPLSNFASEYYGCNVDELTLVKGKYDPFNVFKYPQSIRY
ncbi:FAD-dependent oxidoreductase [Clostridium sp.]|uniref:FAD-dependent oxidoreductase n=1 Tax=Clostridium sp. TaxID=1506 RepID=UPI002FCCA687